MTHITSLATIRSIERASHARNLVCTGLCWSDGESTSMSQWSGNRQVEIQRCKNMQDFVRQTLRIQPALLLIEVENSHDERIAFLSQLLSDKGCPRIPVMACSNSTQENVVVQAFKGGDKASRCFTFSDLSAIEFNCKETSHAGGFFYEILSKFII